MSGDVNGLLLSLWHASWQGAVVLALIGIVCRVFGRRLTADAHCWLWRLSYVKLLLGLVWGGAILLPLLAPPLAPPMIQSPTVALPAPMAAPVSSAGDMTAAASPVPIAANAGHLPDWPTLLAAVYAVGVAVCLGRLFAAVLRTRHALRLSVPINAGPETACAAELAPQMGLRRVPPLARSAAVDSPVFLAGRVLLPADARYAEGDLRMILAHELAHARRRDLAWEWLGTLVQVVFFFHPFVILARREERLAREAAADALALRATAADAADYGRLLLRLALEPSRPHFPLTGAVGVIEGGSPLRRRLLALRDGAKRRSSWRIVVAVALLMALVVTPWQLTHSHAAPAALSPALPTGAIALHFPKPSGDKSITGVVRDEMGKPVANLDVSLAWHWSQKQADGMPPTGVSTVGHIRTDAQGGFKFANLPTGVFDYGVSSPTNQYVPSQGILTIKKTDTAKTLAVIVSTGSLMTGRVVDGQMHKPMAGIPVGAGPIPAGGNLAKWDYWHIVSIGVTDAQGRYGMRVMPGNIFVGVGRLTNNTLFTHRLKDTVQRVTVRHSQTAAVPDLAVRLNPVLLCVGPDGVPVANARYSIVRQDGATKWYGGLGITDRTGAIVLLCDSGSFNIRLDARTVAGRFHAGPNGTLTVTVDGRTSTYPSGMATVRLPEAPSAVVIGHVVTPNGRPIPNAVVRIDGVDPKSHYRVGERLLKSDASGVFHATLYLNQQNFVCVRADGYNQVDVTSRLPVLKDAATADLGTILLVRAAGSVSGRVVNTSGRPIAGVVAWVRGGETYYSAAITGAQGRFRIPNVVPGESLRLYLCLKGVLTDSGDAGTQSNEMMEFPAAEAGATERRIVWHTHVGRLSGL